MKQYKLFVKGGVCQEKIRENSGVCFKYFKGLFGAQWEQVWSMLGLEQQNGRGWEGNMKMWYKLDTPNEVVNSVKGGSELQA